MTQQPAVQQHPASAEAYIRHGWKLVPIPPGTKGPQHQGWNRAENTLTTESLLPQGYGIGLAHAYSGTMALDIDDWSAASTLLMLHGVDLNALYAAPDAVIIDSGNPGHGKLLYAMPFGLALPSKRINCQGQTLYELRCATANGLTVQDVLPPSIHPTTRQSYRWAGNGRWQNLPTIPQPLLNLWMMLLDQDRERVISTSEHSDTSWEEIRSAVESINPGCSREEWVTVGMALHYAGEETGQGSEAFTLWDEWSQGSPEKYPGARDMLIQWRSFTTGKGNVVKLGSLFHLAHEAGWRRPAPDVAALFANVTPTNPKVIEAYLKPPAPSLNLDLMPPILTKAANEIAESIGCDPLVPLWAGIAAVSGALDARTRLELVPGFQVPPVLWVMTIGEPADKKSPGSHPMFEVLRDLELEDRPRFAQDMSTFELDDARFAAAKKAALDYQATPDALLDPAGGPPIPEAPKQPVPLKIVVQDITSQKLVRRAAERPRGLLCHLDEMNSWIKKVTDPRSGEDRSSWVAAYESKYYEMDRVGAGTFTCDNYAVSIYGNMQPEVFRRSLGSLSEDGLVQRFIPVALRAHMTKLGHPVPDHLSCRKEYEQMIRVAYSLPALTYKLSPEAYTLFREFQAWYEQAKADERLLRPEGVYMTSFGKIEGLTGRLALIFHACENPYSLEVSADTMTRVIRLVRSYVIPSLRHTYNKVGGLADGSLDEWAANYTIQYSGERDTLHLRDLARAARHKLSGVAPYQRDVTLTDAMVGLEQAGWVTRIQDRPGTRDIAWAINPALKTMFADHRKAVILAKQRIVDQGYAVAEQHYGRQVDEYRRVAGYESVMMG